MELPLVSFGIPTYNEERYIGRCLESIFSQDYPQDKIEVLIIDDGSTDRTLEICARYPVRILPNRAGSEMEQVIQAAAGARRGPEAGRRLGVEASQGEFVVLLSADNELATRDWLTKMVKPVLEDEEVVAVRPPVSAPRQDPAINRSLALLETKTPIEFYIFRMRRPKRVVAKNGYLIDIVDNESYPPLVGGNGTLLRKEVVLKAGNIPTDGSDIDLMCHLIQAGLNKFAYVPEAVVYHHYVHGYWHFTKRLRAKVKWFLLYSREYPWLPRQRGEFLKTLLWLLFCATFVGPLIHAFFMRKKGDPAWLYHPLACLTAVVVYAAAFLVHARGRRALRGMLATAMRGG